MKNKLIWMCWFQGEEHLKGLNELCVQRWKKINPDWQVNILSNDTIYQYVPEYFDIIKNSPPRRRPAKSDLLRILLLSKYGGVWVDVSVYPVLPLSEYYHDIVNQTGFFTYRFKPRSINKKGDRETVSWFICVDKANHILINLWKESFIDKFQTLDVWKYFTFHGTLTELYDSNSDVRDIINNMVQIDPMIPHSAVKKWEYRKDSYMYKRPKIVFKK